MNLMRVGTASLMMLAVLPSLAAAQQPEQRIVRHQAAGHDMFAGERFELPEGADAVSVPFRNVNQHILLPVMVNGKGPFDVVLDTGMPIGGVILHDSERVEGLDLSYMDGVQVKVGGAGGKGEAHSARLATNVGLRIGDLAILDARATVVPMPGGFGTYFDGIIGAGLFQNFVVTIDNDRGVLTLSRPESYKPPEGVVAVPITLDGGMPFVEARVQIGDAPAVPVQLVVDIGATHAVSLNEGDDPKIAAPANAIATMIGRGASGEVTGHIGRIRSLEVGGFALPDVVATFPDAAHHWARGMDSRNGNLGNGALSRFNVTFDYAGKRMLLARGKRASEPFEWDMSGMQGEPTGEGTVRVRRVLPGSPAAEAGVEENDRIVRIAGEAVTGENYFTMRERLRKNGETVAVELLRGDKPVSVSIKLRRLV